MFNAQVEQLKLFVSQVEPPADDPQVARVLVNRVGLERTRQFGTAFPDWELWKHLELDRFFGSSLRAAPSVTMLAWLFKCALGLYFELWTCMCCRATA